MLFILALACSEQEDAVESQETSKEVIVEQKTATNSAQTSGKTSDKKKNIIEKDEYIDEREVRDNLETIYHSPKQVERARDQDIDNDKDRAR